MRACIRTGTLLLLSMPMLGGCATTLGAGVQPALVRSPPYYAGDAPLPAGAVVAHAAVFYQRGATAPAGVEPSGDEGKPMAAVVADLDAALDRLGLSRRLALHGVRGRPPDVAFGCHGPGGALCDPDRGFDGPGEPEHWLQVTRPSAGWVEGVASALDAASATHLLVITVELSEYWVRVRETEKYVELGSGHRTPVPWYGSLEQPVMVLQITGALVGRDGRSLRIGAEGLLARPSGLIMTAVGASTAIRDADLEGLRAARRDDLRDRPLVVEESLRSLVATLLDTDVLHGRGASDRQAPGPPPPSVDSRGYTG